MQNRLVTAALLVTLGFGSAGAQSTTPNCPGGAALSSAQITQDACQQTYDLFQYLAPQLGAAISGGNTTLGQGGALGGLGHFTVEVRGNVVWAQIPNVAQFPAPSPTGAKSQQLPTTSTFLPMATADGAIGVFSGFPVGITNIGGVDLLVSGSYIPTVNTNNVSVTPQTNYGFGFGARLGILQEGLIAPGVGISILQRNIPTTNIIGTEGSTTLTVDTATVKTTATRLTVSKNLILFDIALGVGQDKYTQAATVKASAGGQSSAPIAFSQSMTRSNMFADVTMNLIILKLVVEGGRVSGGTANTYNTFSGGPANSGHNYASAGVRFNW